MMKIFNLILAGMLSAMLLTGCGTDDNSNITPSPTPDTANGTANNQTGNNMADDAKSGMEDVGDAVSDLTQGAGNAVKDSVDGVEGAVDSMTGNNK